MLARKSANYCNLIMICVRVLRNLYTCLLPWPVWSSYYSCCIVLLCQVKKLYVMISVKQVSQRVLNITKDFIFFNRFFLCVRLFLSVLHGQSLFHPRHNGQWPPTSKDFYTMSYPLHYFLILILEKEPLFTYFLFNNKRWKERRLKAFDI